MRISAGKNQTIANSSCQPTHVSFSRIRHDRCHNNTPAPRDFNHNTPAFCTTKRPTKAHTHPTIAKSNPSHQASDCQLSPNQILTHQRTPTPREFRHSMPPRDPPATRRRRSIRRASTAPRGRAADSTAIARALLRSLGSLRETTVHPAVLRPSSRTQTSTHPGTQAPRLPRTYTLTRSRPHIPENHPEIVERFVRGLAVIVAAARRTISRIASALC